MMVPCATCCGLILRVSQVDIAVAIGLILRVDPVVIAVAMIAQSGPLPNLRNVVLSLYRL